MRRLLLVDRSDEDAEVLQSALLRRGFEVRIEDQLCRAVQALRQRVPEWEFVVIVAGNTPQEDVNLLRELVEASRQLNQSGLPEFVFASIASCMPSLRVQMGNLGVRYVHV